MPGFFHYRQDKMSNPLQQATAINVSLALQEDLGSGDVTAALVSEAATARAIILSREFMVMAGQPWVNEVFRQIDPDVAVEWMFNDGDRIDADSEICILQGPARSILSGERTALNFLQTLSATATVTARYVAEVEGTGARVLDTRKTIPGLRIAAKVRRSLRRRQQPPHGLV